MANTNPTVIAAHLNDTELRSSIDSLVKHVDEQATAMAMSMDAAVSLMKQSLQQLGNVRIDLGGARGGASLTKGQSELKAEVKETTIAYDQMAHAMTRATSNKTIIDAYDMQIQLLLEDLKKARHDIEFFQQAAASPYIGNKAEYGQRATASAQEAERLMRVITELEQKKQALQGVMRPQGDTIKNFIHDLQKVNPELEQLNQQYRNGTSLLQQQATSAQQVVSATEQEAKGAERFTSALETNEQYAKRVAEILRNTPIMNESYEQSMRGRGGNAQDSAVEIKKNFQAYEDFASAIAHVLNVQRNEVVLADERIASYNKLQATLTQLQQAYQKLTSRERESDNGKALASSIQEVQRAIQKVQTQMQRPVNLKAVLGLDEKTLDDIAYKIRMLQSYRQGIVLTSPNASKEIDQVNKSLEQLQKQQREVMGANTSWIHSNNAVARSLNYMKNRLAFIFTVGATTQFAKQLIEIRSQYELLERSIGILFDSMQNGTRIFAELNDMALRSPFTTLELGAAAKQLSAYDIAAKDVVDTTRRLADMAAAVGVPIERLTYALGQIKAYGYLNARDARMFANAGIPLVKNLADMFSELEGRMVSVGDVYDRIKKKAISFEDVMKVVNKMTDEGGRFFDFQEKSADTLKVQLANLTLAYNTMLNGIGQAHQGIFTTSLKGLKWLFQQWQSIDRIIKSLVLSFGIFKVAQMVAINYNWKIAQSASGAAKQMTYLSKTVQSVRTSLAALASNPWTWIFVAISAIVDLTRQFDQAQEAIHELNEGIRNDAKEASDSLLSFLSNTENKATRETAILKKLSKEQGEKAWGLIREEIEKSASSSEQLIAQLLTIPDINERVAKSFDLVERIQKAQGALQDLKDDTIQITSSFGWGGIFGEGLVDDLKDYYKELSNLQSWSKEYNWDFGWSDFISAGPVKSQREEFLKELDITAESIKNFLDAYNIKDPLQINEIFARAKAQIRAKNPEIRGELANLFTFELDTRMSELTNGAIDSSASMWAMFMERLKQKSSSAFADINNDWVRKNKELNFIQRKAIDDNLKYFKNQMPYAYDAIKKLVDDSSKLRIQIGVTFNKEIPEKSVYDTLVEADQKLEQAQKRRERIGQRLRQLEKENKQTTDEYTNAQNELTQATKDYNDALAKGGVLKEKKTNKGGKKDVLGEALQKEVEIVSNLTKKYKEYWNMGVNSTDAINKTAQEYNNTLNNVNNTLAKFGITGTKSVKELANLGLQDIKAYYESLLVFAKQKGNTKGIEAIEKAIDNLNTEITKQDYKTYADSLNSELSKIKDEYELSLDLEANPELGQSFMDLMGIVPEQLPRTLKQYADRLVFALNEYIKKANVNLPEFTSLNLTDDDLRYYESLVEKQELTKVAYDEIVKAVKMYREAAKKEFDTDINNWNKLIEKYGQLEAKIQKIQNDAAQERLDFIRQFGSESQKEIAVKLVPDLKKETDPQIRQGLIDDLKALTTEVAGTDAARIDVKIAIDDSEVDKISEETFKEFQKTPEWMLALGDLSGLTHKALGMLIKDIRAFASANKKLSDKDLRKIAKTIKQLQEAQRKDNPFLRIKDAIENARERVKPFEEKLKGLKKELKEYQTQAKNTTGNQDGLNKKIKDTETKINQTKKQIRLFRQVSIKSILEGIQEIKSAADTVISSVAEMFAAFGNEGASEALKTLSSIADKAMQFAQIGSVFGRLGAAIGAILGGLMGLFTSLAEAISGNATITEAIEGSERLVKRLENAYKRLERAISEAFGTQSMGVRAAMIGNKALQLAELRNQLSLERRRTSKYYDEDKIIDLEGQIIDLEYEIKDLQNDIVNNFLGISSVSDAVSDMVGTLIDSLRNGEDAMSNFDESINNMIANMIKQVVMAEIVGPKLQAIWDSISEELQKRAELASTQLAYKQKEYDDIVASQGQNLYFYKDQYGNVSIAKGYEDYIHKLQEQAQKEREEFVDAFGNVHTPGVESGRYTSVFQSATYEEWKAQMEETLAGLMDNITQANMPTMDDIRTYAEQLRGISPEISGYIDTLQSILEEMGLIKDTTKDKSLSLLQQGIQGVTEDTAGALEGYLNIVSQRMFYHSTLLEEIRDRISSFDANIQLGTLGQMLLQLQNSYQVQMSIQNILQGTLTPSGRAFTVELAS
jgi:chromosome segregation ATPase